MEKDGKLIYRGRHPRISWEEVEALTEEEGGSPRKTTEEALQDLRHSLYDAEYVPKPGTEEGSRRMVALAKELSETYGINMDIREKPYGVEVNFQVEHSAFPRGMVHLLGELLRMSDGMSTFPPADGEPGAIISLDYYTHDRYLDGKLMKVF